MHTFIFYSLCASAHLDMGPTGFDGEIKSNASMRGVVSSTSPNKLSQNVIGTTCHSKANRDNVLALYSPMHTAAVAA